LRRHVLNVFRLGTAHGVALVAVARAAYLPRTRSRIPFRKLNFPIGNFLRRNEIGRFLPVNCVVFRACRGVREFRSSGVREFRSSSDQTLALKRRRRAGIVASWTPGKRSILDQGSEERNDGGPQAAGGACCWQRPKRGRGGPRHNVGRASSPVRLPKTAWKLAKPQSASERRFENRPALQRRLPVFQYKLGSPSRRAGVKA